MRTTDGTDYTDIEAFIVVPSNPTGEHTSEVITIELFQ